MKQSSGTAHTWESDFFVIIAGGVVVIGNGQLLQQTIFVELIAHENCR